MVCFVIYCFHITSMRDNVQKDIAVTLLSHYFDPFSHICHSHLKHDSITFDAKITFICKNNLF